MFNKIYVICFFLHLPSSVFADMIGYNKIVSIVTENRQYKFIHTHDWSERTRKQRSEVVKGDLNQFTSKNDYSRLICISKGTGGIVFDVPVPALTNLVISPDSKYIVGLSDIKLWNPIRLVIYDINGNLVKHRSVSSVEAQLTQSELNLFKKSFPVQLKILEDMGRVYKRNGKYYLDYTFINSPKRLGQAWEYLYKYLKPNELIDVYSSSVTNHIKWYDSDKPIKSFDIEDGVLKGITIQGFEGVTSYISIIEI